MIASKLKSISLSPERASFGELRLSSSRLAQNRLAVSAYHNGLRVTEHSRDVEASLAFHIHEEGIRRLNKTLELVLRLLKRCWWVKQIDIVLKNHLRKNLKRRLSRAATANNRREREF
uniref:Uncharacterized protein n=1 Tax=Noccaea caerulescens TaxID=107243 RepID=A0A1J3E0P3_NOCCA